MKRLWTWPAAAAAAILLAGCTEPAGRPDIGSPPVCDEPARICADSLYPAVCTDTGWFCPSDTVRVCDTAWRSDTSVLRAILDSNGLFTVGALSIRGWEFDTLVVRMILNRNSMPGLTVNDIVTRYDIDECGRILRLNLSAPALIEAGGHALARIPESIGLLDQLRYLSLFNNTLDSLPASLGALRRLQELKVQHCNLRRLPDALCELDSLALLYAFGNRLRLLPDSIGRLPHLGILEIANNELDSLPPSLTQSPSLQRGRVSVSGNYLCAVTAEMAAWLDTASYEGSNWRATQHNCAFLFADTAALRHMLDSLGADTLGVGAVAVVRAGRVSRLNLASWGLTALPVQVVLLDSLEVLVLDSNAITVLPGDIDSLSALRELHCAANLLEAATTASLERLRRLRVLILAGNRFSSPPPALSLLDSLTVLNLSDNGLDSLPSLDRMKMLRELRIHDNTLRSLPPLDSLAALRVLDVARCSLIVMHPGIGRLSALDTLDMSDNMLSGLPVEITWLSGPVTVHAGGNRLCLLQVAVENWLDQKAGADWKARQDCP